MVAGLRACVFALFLLSFPAMAENALTLAGSETDLASESGPNLSNAAAPGRPDGGLDGRRYGDDGARVVRRIDGAFAPEVQDARSDGTAASEDAKEGADTGSARLLSFVSDLVNPAAAAVADGLSTRLMLSAGFVEKNPLLGSSPSNALLVAGTVAKVLASGFIRELPDDGRVAAMGILTGVWSAVSVNNLALAMHFGGAAPIVLGLAAGAGLGLMALDSERSMVAAEADRIELVR